MRSSTTRALRVVAAGAALALTTTACLGGGTGSGDGDGGGGEGGGTVDVLDAFTEEGDQAGFQAAVDLFEEQSGATVQLEHSSSLDDQAVTRVAGGNPPDIIVHPQPGLLEDLVSRGNATPLDFLDPGSLDLVEGLADLGTFDDQFYGLPIKLQLKSMVWYPKAAFDEAGYQVPTTWDEMLALSQQIAQDQGVTPWCIGIESADATGWVATDWIEDVMLRLHGPDVYDQWVAHEVVFDSPEVTAAFEQVAGIWFDDTLAPPRPAILSTPFGDAPAPMFEDPPGCFLHRQASFIEGNFPEDAEFGTDYDFFPLPAIDEAIGTPALIAGDTAALYTDNEAAKEFLTFLATPEAQQAWAEAGNYLCTLTTCDTSVYPSEAFAQQDEFLKQAVFARFDASDLMPGEVGAGAFWSEAVSWVAGEQELQPTLQAIDSAWPQSEE